MYAWNVYTIIQQYCSKDWKRQQILNLLKPSLYRVLGIENIFQKKINN